MTTLDAYARFLTARWDEQEAEDWHAADCEQNTYNAGPCDCGVPALTTADLAAKRAILREAASVDTLLNARPSSQARLGAQAAFQATLEHLAEPFRDHPDHYSNQER